MSFPSVADSADPDSQSHAGVTHGYLDDGEPFVRVFLVPDTVNIAGARCIGYLVPHLCYLCKEFDVALTQFRVGPIDFHADGCREFRQSLEFHNIRVFLRRLNFLAILYFEIFRLVLLGCLYGEAIPRFGTFAAEPGHFGGHNGHQMLPEGIIAGKNGPVVRDND